MSTISLCMIVKNEEKYLARCLNSVKSIVDEIIIVDTGSSDKTKQIAKKYTNNIFDFVWQDDFSMARNYSFSLAKCNYIMWLDADDIIPKNTQKELLKLKPSLSADTYMLKYDIAFNLNKPTFSYYRERIVRNCGKAKWQGVVHECITPFGKIEHLNLSIQHKKESFEKNTRNLKIYQNLLKKRPLSTREQYYFARELYDHKRYRKCVTEMKKFISLKKAWSENVIDGLYILSKCYRFLNNQQASLDCLYKTFNYDTPRANICCAIADHFYNNKQYEQAKFWYSEATHCKDCSHKGGFVENQYYNYYPYLQLACTCYYLGDIKTAILYNKKAGSYYHSPQVKYNETFFNNITT